MVVHQIIVNPNKAEKILLHFSIEIMVTNKREVQRENKIFGLVVATPF